MVLSITQQASSLVDRSAEWLRHERVEAIETWLRARAITTHCPYIYPPTSRYTALGPEVYGEPDDWGARHPSLYVHVPYCLYRCSFCNFALDELRHTGTPVQLFLELLEREADALLARTGRAKVPIGTLYIGGGTPSVLTVDQLERLLTIVAARFPADPDAELTVEVNPETVCNQDRQKPAVLKRHGVNRVSMGVQILEDELLQMLGRRHRVNTVDAAVAALRDAGIETLNIDLMHDLPRLTPEIWQRSLERAVALGPDSITVYELRISPESKLTVLSGERRYGPRLFQAMAHLFLTERGYARTSSNQYVRAARHMQRHYVDVRERLVDVIGLGVSAIAKVGPFSFNATRSVQAWSAEVEAGRQTYEGVKMTQAEQCSRAVVLGLKSPRGISLETFRERLGCDLSSAFPGALAMAMEQGLIEQHAGCVRTTAPGGFLLDQVASLFFQHIDHETIQSREVEHLGVRWHR